MKGSRPARMPRGTGFGERDPGQYAPEPPAIPIARLQDLAMLGGDRVERGLDLLVLDLRGRRLLRGERLGEEGLSGGGERGRHSLAASQLVDVPEDRVEPGAAVRAAIELRKRLPRLEEDLLGEVLRLRRAAR